MIETLVELDKEVFLFFNGLHAPWLDPIMLYLTQTFVWIPLYALLLYLTIRNYTNDSWAPLLALLITIVLSDQITSGMMKPLFERLRPSRDPEIASFVHIVNGYKGGLYGFASSHAANTLACALFFWVIFRNKYKWIVLLFAWAIFMSYSRIYLGVHYPGDIIAGMFIGTGCAWVGLRTLRWLGKFMKTSGAQIH